MVVVTLEALTVVVVDFAVVAAGVVAVAAVVFVVVGQETSPGHGDTDSASSEIIDHALISSVKTEDS